MKPSKMKIITQLILDDVLHRAQKNRISLNDLDLTGDDHATLCAEIYPHIQSSINEEKFMILLNKNDEIMKISQSYEESKPFFPLDMRIIKKVKPTIFQPAILSPDIPPIDVFYLKSHTENFAIYKRE